MKRIFTIIMLGLSGAVIGGMIGITSGWLVESGCTMQAYTSWYMERAVMISGIAYSVLGLLYGIIKGLDMPKRKREQFRYDGTIRKKE